ncbi:MAG: glycosyltransferase family 2 protein [Kiritimatiellae bacterium]|nr:glycosyltransferase family 2 protein [Kiritimatiellia bacterium]
MSEVSLILPLYNADKRCLGDCIDSIKAQTFSDFECVFVNDGSPNRDCIEYAANSVRGDSRFHLAEKSNGGLASARNFGILHSGGEYVTFVDQDDILHPQRIELALRAMEATTADVCECKVVRIPFTASFLNGSYPHFATDTILESTDLLDGRDILSWYLGQKMNITVWSHFYRRQIFERRLLPESVWGSDDLAFNIVNASEVKSLAKIRHPLYFWRRNPKATTERVPLAFPTGVAEAIEYVLNHYHDHPTLGALSEPLSNYLAGAFADAMRKSLMVKRDGAERSKLVELAVRADDLLDGKLALRIAEEDKIWISRLLAGKYDSAVRNAKSAAAARVRRNLFRIAKTHLKRLFISTKSP